LILQIFTNQTFISKIYSPCDKSTVWDTEACCVTCLLCCQYSWQGLMTIVLEH